MPCSAAQVLQRSGSFRRPGSSSPTDNSSRSHEEDLKMASSLSAQSAGDGMALYEKYVNPQWVRLLDVLQMNVRYRRCIGTELHTEDGRIILDFNSGYCVH